MRRIAWNACRSCSPASRSMCAASLASSALAGWIVSPRSRSTRRDRLLGEPVDLEARARARAARRRSRRRARRGRARSARRRTARAWSRSSAARPGPRRAAAARRVGELAQQQVDLDGVARLRSVARALDRARARAPVSSASRAAALERDDRGRASPWTTSDRAADAAAQRLHAWPSSAAVVAVDCVAISVSGVVSSPHATQSSICFVECGSRKTSREEELEEVAVVAQPVVAVVLRPALVGRRARSSKPTRARSRRRDQARDRADRSANDAGDALGVRRPRACSARSAAAARCPATHGATRRRPRRARRPRRRRTRARRTRRRRAGGPTARCRAPSKVTTRKWRARYGICAFQWREWTIDHAGRSRIAGRAASRSDSQ